MKRTSFIVSLTSILVVVTLAVGFFVTGARPQLGLDLQGGISAALQPDPEAGNQPEDLNAAMDLAVTLIRQRVDSLGVAEPDIARQGDDTILVQLPGITDADRARQVIGQTAQLAFHPVQRLVPPFDPAYAETPPCLVPDVDDAGDPVLDADGEPVYVANPDRPSPSRPTEDGTRYVCGERQDPDAEREPIDTGADSPRVEDLLTDQPTEPGTESPDEAATDDETATDEPTGDAMPAYTAADATDTTEAPSPDDTGTATDAPTDMPTDMPTEAPPPVDDGLPEDAPRPIKYVVGPIPTDQVALPDDATDAPTDAATGAAQTEDEGATELPGDPLTGDDIDDASATVGGQGWVVQLDLDADGGEAFRLATAELACLRDAGQPGQLAIVLDDVVRSAPNMAQGVACGQGIAGGTATITVGGGGQDPEAAQEDAQNLALVLNVGALPLTLTEATFDTVSPSLGAASLRSGLIAGLIGLLLVAIYLVFFYRTLGVVALGGLGIFGVLVIGTITLMGQAGFALTLAGVAGIIVAIGITADSSIIYFERIRDEIALGKTMRTAARKGFDSAFRTNLAGNTVTLAAALILYFLAVGPVRGFAFTLGLATILDIVIMWAWTRSVVGLLAGSRRLTRESVRVPTAVPAPDATPGGAA